jgi:hypothetical protein
MIMRKETFSIHAENEIARDQLMKDLLDCIEFAATGEYSFRDQEDRPELSFSPTEWSRATTVSCWRCKIALFLVRYTVRRERYAKYPLSFAILGRLFT